MRVEVKPGRLDKVRDSVAVFAALESQEHPESFLPGDSLRDTRLLKTIAHSGFRGALNETLLLPAPAGSKQRSGPEGDRWILVVGLGKAKDLSLERLRQFAATTAKRLRAQGMTRFVLPVLSGKLGSPTVVAQALTEGVLLGLYRYDKLRKQTPQEQKRRIESVTLLVERASDAASARLGEKRGEIIAEAVCLARDYINGPSNFVTPTFLAAEARRIARKQKLKCTVIAFARLKKLGFGGIAAVAQGSSHPAQFIVLEYAPSRARATIALCGKGITFDTGGINLKTTANRIELMKYDMSGAAAVLASLQAAAKLKLPVRLIGIIAATENMPSGSAQKPSDVLKTLSGKTVEVLNTDAEGRLVLSDCLHYAKRFKPDATIDIATLTGACTVALGSQAIGLLSNNDALASRVADAAETVRERVWRLPLWEEYGGSYIKSDIADLKNISGTTEAGTITAAKFLEQFVEGMKWAHLDIASTAWNEKEKPYVPKGAVGIGVRLLIQMMTDWK